MIEVQTYEYYAIRDKRIKKIKVDAMDRMEAIGRLNQALRKAEGYKLITFGRQKK